MFMFNSQVDVREEFIPEKCELFESEVYLEEVSDVICIAQAELPSLLALNQLAEALLRVKHGPWLLCQLVANAPNSFEQGKSYININCVVLQVDILERVLKFLTVKRGTHAV